MGHSRPRYNEKGRAVQRQTGKRKRTEDYQLDDSNADILDPELRKKRRAELLAAKAEQDAPKMSAKKKKRLDAYIERKLKKEQRKDLIASLAQTQTQNLQFASSSALGSKQFKSQAAKLDHANSLEDSRRGRARRILERANAGKSNLSDSEGEGEEDQDADMADSGDEDLPLEREFVKPQQALALSTAAPVASKKASQPFNPSGAVGVIVEPAPALPVASTSSAPPAASTPSGPAPLAVGSALASGATVTVVKRAPKQRGRMRQLVTAVGKGKGKAKAVEEEEEESDFDSSEATSGEGSDEEDDSASEDGDEEEWTGIDGAGEDAAAANSHSASDEEGGSGDDGGEMSDEEHSDEEAEAADDAPKRPPRERGAFRAWADEQVLKAAGQEADASAQPAEVDDGTYKPLLPAGSGFKNRVDPSGITGPLGAVIPKSELPSLPPQRTVHIAVTRTPEIEASRAELPVVKEEDRVMEVIRGHPVVVLCGETGSGKTTQIGQFLWEAGFGDPSSDNPGMVAITQPRRVAALSTSARVRTELGLSDDSSLVAHRIRYSSTSAADTKLVFMTDGVLLRELAADFLLTKYSVVVVDEAHERGVNTDVLIGVLSRVAKLREKQWRSGKEGAKPLRLIIMSATLRVSDFAENPTLFSQPPPVLHITARQHPVTIHFARRTQHDYLAQAYKKVARIHARLPPGGVLVFCTGQNEIVSLVKRLEAKFGPRAVKARKERVQRAAEARRNGAAAAAFAARTEEEDEAEADEVEAKLRGRIEVGDDLETEEVELGEDKDLAADVDDGVYHDDDEEALESDDDEDDTFKGIDMEEDVDEPMHILPLYSLLPTEKQMKVFAEPPAGHRLVVVATNVAETAITIPNIKYVVDTGRAKERKFDHASGIQSFEVDWISKASAAQRAGRAGRTGPGHCYRLYSSAVFEQHFEQFAKPEILRMPIEGIVLTMKSMNIDAVANFPFPTPPDRDALRRAEKTLVNLGALEASDAASKVGGKITTLGRSMALFPLSPRFSKMIVAGQQHGCLPYVIAIVCSLSVGDPFIREANLGDDDDDNEASVGTGVGEKTLTRAEIQHIRDPELRAKEERKILRKSFFQVQQRYSALGKGTSDLFKLLSVVGAYEYEGGRESFCEANFVRTKAMQEIHKLRAQISRIVQSTFPGIDAGFVPKLAPPNETQLKVLRQLVTAAFIDQIAIRKDLVDKSSNISYTKVPSTRGVPYRAFGIDEDLFIHPSSNLFHNAPAEFIVFNELHRTHKVWLKTITKVNPAWLPMLGRPMCTFSKPIETPAQALAAKAASTAGGSADTKTIFVVPRFGPGVGIELKPVQMQQKLIGGRWVLQ
ncbi:ATP-dependent RNA helicase ECM16 [Rhodotorula paludigena]|uniref:ATP-dependent RNA helicase ECM16 n=1 Tax=Rhodotorula paludigena TaxID=86838 RepID=UPI00317F2C72